MQHQQRVIKFRAWDGAKGAWLHQAKTPDMAIHLTGETIMFGELWRRPDDSTVPMNEMPKVEWMQFTGLKDKNGVEIYEGDVINGGEQIVFDEGMFCLDGEGGESLAWVKRNDKTLDVIGNIYENPDLLTSV